MSSSALPAVASRDGFPEAQRLARDFTCAECGGALTALRIGERYQAVCGRDHGHRAVRSSVEAEQEQMRQRLEADPRLSQALAISGARIPLATQAIRDLDNTKLLARVPARYGDVQVSPELRQQIAQAARIYGVDPLFDLMVYANRLYVTYDGRLRKLRDDPNLLPPKTRFLNREEKEAMGYEAQDLVVECTVEHRNGGAFMDWGVVRAKGETSPVARTHPQQMALKRAIARCSRQAVGLDLPTFDHDSGPVVDGVYEEVSASAALPDPAAFDRKRFWAIARGSRDEGGLQLDESQVHTLLRVETLTGYPGSWPQALADLQAAVQQQAERTAVEQAQDAPDEPAEPPDADPSPGSGGIDLDAELHPVTGGEAFTCADCGKEVASVTHDGQVVPARLWLQDLADSGLVDPVCATCLGKRDRAAAKRASLDLPASADLPF